MGYYTHFSMRTIPAGFEDRVRSTLAEMFDQHIGYNPLDEDADPTKWYDCDAHCKSVSAVEWLRHVAIVLDGDGEEPGDVWRNVFLNGELAWSWKADATRPDVPENIVAATADDVRGLEEARKTALSKLTLVEKRALGIE